MCRYVHLSFFGMFIINIFSQPMNDSPQLSGWNLVWQDEFDADTINYEDWGHDIGRGAPVFEAFGVSSPEFSPEGYPRDNFSVQWNGFIIPEYTTEYTFYIVADDGVRLWVDEKLIIDKWIPQAPTEWSEKVKLIANKKYTLKIDYFENTGGETLILGWECDHFQKCLIPNERLFTPEMRLGLSGQYYNGISLDDGKNNHMITRTDSVINWSTGTGWGNNEEQYYTDRNKNIRIENGKLIIEAHQEYLHGSNYSSSRIKTSGSWKYGRFEIKAKLPPGRGTWSALWALPTEWIYGDWPKSGEIDIIEHVGFNEGQVISSVHNQFLSGNVYQSDQQSAITVEDACRSFHVYTLEWEKDDIFISVDSIPILQYKNTNHGWEKWPFDQPFHILMNIAIGGNWGGMEGIDDSIFPSKMEIDYVRVYKRKT